MSTSTSPTPWINATDTWSTPSPTDSCSNGTSGESSAQLTNRIASQVFSAVLMFGLGCSTNPLVMWEYVKKTKQFATALVLQLFLMPWLGLGLTQAFRMTEAQVTGVIIQACCPGGIYSNIVSYYLDGSINLSIVMTSVSSIVALGTMPLWLFVFPLILQVENNCLRVPFDALGIALLGIFVPLILGLIVKYKFPKQSEIITKIFTAAGSLAIVIYGIVAGVVQDTGFLSNFSWKIPVAALLLFTFALCLGYLATRVPWLSCDVRTRRTVAIETAFQNTGLGLTIVFVSFAPESPNFGSILIFPLLYAGLQLFSSAASVIIYLILKWRKKCLFLVPPNDDDDEEENEEGGENMEKVNLENKFAISNPVFVSDSPEPVSRI